MVPSGGARCLAGSSTSTTARRRNGPPHGARWHFRATQPKLSVLREDDFRWPLTTAPEWSRPRGRATVALCVSAGNRKVEAGNCVAGPTPAGGAAGGRRDRLTRECLLRRAAGRGGAGASARRGATARRDAALTGGGGRVAPGEDTTAVPCRLCAALPPTDPRPGTRDRARLLRDNDAQVDALVDGTKVLRIFWSFQPQSTIDAVRGSPYTGQQVGTESAHPIRPSRSRLPAPRNAGQRRVRPGAAATP